jgi:hypothetical protein
MARTKASAKPLIDHDEILRWAEQRNAKPACVRRTGAGNDVGMIRLDFPGYSGEGSLEEITWDDWFQKFDESNLALLVQEETARGQKSNFNKLVSRDTADESGRRRGRSSPDSAFRGASRREPSGFQSATSDDDSDVEDDDSDVEEEEDTEELEMEVAPRRTGSRTTSSGARSKRQGRSTGASRSRGARAVASRQASSSAQGRRKRRTSASATSRQRSSARRTSSRSSRSSRKSRTVRSTSRGNSRGLTIAGKKSAGRARSPHSGSGRGRGGSRRAA